MLVRHRPSGDTMNNNDTLRRLRYALDLSNEHMVSIFALAGKTVTIEQTHAFMEGRRRCEIPHRRLLRRLSRWPGHRPPWTAACRETETPAKLN